MVTINWKCRETKCRLKLNMPLQCTIYLLLLLALLLPQPMHGEIFTSMADMEQMVVSEKKMLHELSNYISEEEKKLDEIKKFMFRVDGALQHVNASEVGKYLGNPINSYLMLKRFNVDWKKIEKKIEVDIAGSLNAVFENLRPFFPTPEDHEGAMDALFRLQSTYNLQSSSLASGVIPGVSHLSVQPLNIQDIYELGSYAYNKKNWPHAIQWLTTALEKLGDKLTFSNVDKTVVLDHLAYAFFESGDIRNAYKYTAELAKLVPKNNRIMTNLVYFQRELKQLQGSKRGDLGDEEAGKVVETNKKIKSAEEMEREVTMRSYEKLCRGEARNVTIKEQRKLKCWYKQKNPMLRLKPQKVERLWVTPEILLFHDIIRDSQIKWIKDTAHPILRRATIQDPITGKLRFADYRVSKSAWLSPDDYPEVDKLNARASAVTGLDMRCSEHLQIANYGIGGHYEPHFDHARDEEDQFSDLGMGNRIATLLFYLSDVKAGGATVFTNAHATVFPVKNAAVFWYNLKRNGKGRFMTRHAACPVLAGQKWVSNWWIHEYGQTFKRPCALNKNW